MIQTCAFCVWTLFLFHLLFSSLFAFPSQPRFILLFYFLCNAVCFSWPFLLPWSHSPHLHLCSTAVPYMIPAQIWQVGQLLHLDDAIIEAGLQTLGHHVGKNDSYHHGQDVGNLTCQLKADHRSGYSVAHCSCQSCCTFPR